MGKTPLKKQKKSTRITENYQEQLHYKKSSYTDDHLKIYYISHSIIS